MVYPSKKYTRTTSYLLLLALQSHLVMKALTVYGFQIVPHHTTFTHGDFIRRMNLASQKQNHRLLASSSELMEPSTNEDTTDAPSSVRSSEAYIIQNLRQELIELGKRTERGFKASRADRERAEKLIFDLAQYNQVREPVRTYYGEKHQNENVDNNDAAAETATIPSIQGKWTLIYTDAPDITGLGVPSPFVTLGRIGQDCSNPPYIANVIEWRSPAWANKIPFLVGKNKNNTNESARILQKVVTFGSAVPASPMVVDLNVAGLQLSSGTTTTAEMSTSIDSNHNINKTSISNDLRTAIDEDGLIVGVLKQQQKDKPNIDLLKLDEARQPPFGSFEILYLDDTLRITKTSRNHYAINVRIESTEDEWF